MDLFNVCIKMLEYKEYYPLLRIGEVGRSRKPEPRVKNNDVKKLRKV